MSPAARSRLALLVVAAGSLLAVARCSCSEDGGGGGGGGGGAPAPVAAPACELDLSPYLAAEGTGSSRAKQIDAEAELIGGEAANGRLGDFLLANDQIRVIVQQSDRNIGANPYGGNVIDADVVRAAGEPGSDVLGEIAPFWNFGRTSDPEAPGDVFVLRDGADGGAAVVAVNARDTQNDFLFVKGLVGQIVPGAEVQLDSEADVPVKITNYYVLAPGSSRVRYVTAMCNTTARALLVGAGDLVDSGGKVQQFNPHSNTNGWGYKTLPTDFPWMAWVGRGSAYALVPADGGQPNQALTISGVTGSIWGARSLYDFLGDPLDPGAPPPGILVIPGNGSAAYDRQIVVGKSLSDLTDVIFTSRGDEVGTVSGTVTAGGAAVAGARIAAVRTRDVSGTERRVAETVFTSDAQGHFGGTLPAGSYQLSADVPGRLGPEAAVTVTVGAEATAALTLPAPGTLHVQIEDLEGNPMPGRVHVMCDPCSTERAAELMHRDVLFDPYPEHVIAIEYVGMSGEVELPLAPGEYRVLVSRGLEYDTFPADWARTRLGTPVTITAGESAQLTAPLARVVDTAGWISADLHVHAINSPDSPVPNDERVVSFLGEQVEILVATDHDFITDFAPAIEALGAGSQVTSVVGDEITTFNYGHFNAFPITRDPASPNGGAIDWAGGRGPTLPPAEIFVAARGLGAQVIQANHPRGALGHFDALRIDTATGASHALPTSFRFAENGADPALDSELFSHEFTAMELQNGYSRKGFQTLMNDWFTFMSRGFVVTGTAVSDTHTWAKGTVGSPRSWIKVASDHPSSVDLAGMAAAVNRHELVGSTGPFLSVTAASGAASAGIGGVLATGGAGNEVTLEVTVQSPTWVEWNRVEVYTHRDGREALDGSANSDWPADGAATQADGSPAVLVVDPADPALLADGAEGGAAHQRRLLHHTFTFAPAADSWYVVVVRSITTGADGLQAGEIAPRDLSPIAYEGSGAGADSNAFANPILVDVDGGGYDAFPLRGLAPKPLPTRSPPVKRPFERPDLELLLEHGEHH